MFIEAGNILLIGSLLLLMSVIAGKTTNRLGVPTLIFFLIVGVLAGSEGIGGIHFDNAALAQFIGIVALNFILFSGGLDTNWQTIKPVLWRGIALSTIGVFLTALSVGAFVHYVFSFTLMCIYGMASSCLFRRYSFSLRVARHYFRISATD